MKSGKDWFATLLFAILLGTLGIHRFYVGKVGTGFIWLITGGIFGIGWVVDIILIALDKFTDKYGFIILKDNYVNRGAGTP
jgi:TM2 domain-containing membrane protein YozV